jgi:hypothetical protein
MSNLAEQLMESASAVAALGASGSDLAALDDASVTAGMALVSHHRRNLQAYEVLLSAEIAKRSSHEFGNAGLARSNGSATSAIFIQSITGSSIDEATKLARLGEMLADSERQQSTDSRDNSHLTDAPPATGPLAAGPFAAGPFATGPLATAAVAGDISVAAADAIRKGLGKPDAAITHEQLRTAETELLKQAGKVSPEALLKLARVARSELDLEAVARGQKQKAAMRYVRAWQRDGMSGGSWSLPDEDGGSEIHTALKLLLASRTGGPRFPETDANGEPIIKTAAEIALEDDRAPEHVLADGFAQIFLNGLRVDPSVVPGAGRAPVRVMVTAKVLQEERGTAILEGSMTAITFAKLEEYLCEGGKVGVLFDDDGKLIDVGREQRLFTKRQRTGLGVRDGGCRYPGCDKPPSWCEAHHIFQWVRDKGRTDTADGILLCRYHHMRIHESGAEITRDGATYWLKPAKSVDPNQTLIEMPSKNPLMAAMKLALAS